MTHFPREFEDGAPPPYTATSSDPKAHSSNTTYQATSSSTTSLERTLGREHAAWGYGEGLSHSDSESSDDDFAPQKQKSWWPQRVRRFSNNSSKSNDVEVAQPRRIRFKKHTRCKSSRAPSILRAGFREHRSRVRLSERLHHQTYGSMGVTSTFVPTTQTPAKDDWWSTTKSLFWYMCVLQVVVLLYLEIKGEVCRWTGDKECREFMWNNFLN